MKKLKNLFSKRIPERNYYIVLSVSIIVILFTLICRTIYLNIKENVISKSVFADSNVKMINEEDMEFVLNEVNEAILYVSYTGVEEIYDSEKSIYKYAKDNELMDKMLYLDVSNEIKTGEYISKLRNVFPEVKSEITQAPMLIYIKDGKAQEAMSSELRVIDNKIFKKLTDKYEIK